MQFGEYQDRSKSTVIYPNPGANFVYPTLGLLSEAGEVAGRVKVLVRDRGGLADAAARRDIEGELGDVLWYLAQTASEFGLSLDEIAERNLEKLEDRRLSGGLRRAA